MKAIEDEELNRLFRAESRERLDKLEAGLLQLEKAPDDPPLIEALFREAHTLKGASRMLGLGEIQQEAHALEDALTVTREGHLLSPDRIQAQLQGIDRIRRLMPEGDGEASSELPPTPQVFSGKPELTLQKTPSITTRREAPTPEPPQPELHLEYLRIDARKLDHLLNQAGELVVSRGHLQRFQRELETTMEWVRQSSGGHDPEALLDQLGALASRLDEENARLGLVTTEIVTGIRNLRLLPITTLFDLLPRLVHDLAREQDKAIDLQLKGGEIVVDKRLIEEMKAPLMHLLRNAVDHGIEPRAERALREKPTNGQIEVVCHQEAERILLEVRDDGRGLDREAIHGQALKQGLLSAVAGEELDDARMIELILQPGFSTASRVTELSGRGVGLDVVRTATERLHGSLSIDSVAGQGTRVVLQLPMALIATRVLLIESGGQTLGLPFEQVTLIRGVHPAELRPMADQTYLVDGHEVIPVGQLGWVLGQSGLPEGADDSLLCVILRAGANLFGVLIDRLLGEQAVVLKSLPFPLRPSALLSGVTILDSGHVCPVLNVEGLHRTLARPPRREVDDLPVLVEEERSAPRSVLLVEDSITTRILEQRILQQAGYEVTPAVDGLDAWNQLTSRDFDAVVTDIRMPNLDGLELTRRIRSHRQFAMLPVILVTSMASEEDRKRGLEAGADLYLCKPEFDQSVLLDSLNRLLGIP